MDIVEMKHLEILLGKLQLEVGEQKICIIPHYVHDSFYISTFKHDGNVDKQIVGLDIEDALMKLKLAYNTQTK